MCVAAEGTVVTGVRGSSLSCRCTRSALAKPVGRDHRSGLVGDLDDAGHSSRPS